jgi:uncharacterized protein (TIGR02301 family)
MVRHSFILALIGLCALLPPTRAQAQSPAPRQTQPQPPAQKQPPPPQVQDIAAPYDANLQRLVEILGSLHYLRPVCGFNDGQKWRDVAQSLIDAETPGGQRRVRMVTAFNRGYQVFQQSYRTCTPAADLVIRRYLDEGSKLDREVTARYAN